MPAITSANVAQAIPKFVAARALPALLARLVMGNLVNRDFEATLATAGDTVNVAIPPVLVANNIIESGSVQPQNPSLGNAQVVLDTHAEATFQIPDVTKALAYPDLVDTYMTPAVNAIATKIETDLLSNYVQFTYNTPVGAATAMDESRIDAAETSMFNALIPTSEPWYLIVSGNAYGQARQIPRFTEFQTGVNRDQTSPIQSGRLVGVADGSIKGFQVWRSQLVPKVSGTTYNIAFARSALALVIRRLPLPMAGTGALGAYEEIGSFGLRIIMSYQPSTLSQVFTVDVLYGTGPLRQSFGIQVLSN